LEYQVIFPNVNVYFFRFWQKKDKIEIKALNLRENEILTCLEILK